MKKLEELGISPAPWRADLDEDFDSNDEVRDKNNEIILCDASHADARLIAAAPELYRCLRDAVEYVCGMCWDCDNGNGYKFRLSDGSCKAKNWRKALELCEPKGGIKSRKKDGGAV